MPSPTKRSYQAFHNVFHHIDQGEAKKYPALGGHDELLLDDQSDLVALKKPIEDDRLTALFRHRLPFFFEVSIRRHRCPVMLTL